jgi:hypothetical protein
MNNWIFNAKTPSRKNAEGKKSQTDSRILSLANRQRFFLFPAPLRLCAFALSLFAIAAFSLCVSAPAADAAKVLYQNNFEKGEVGKLPEEMLLLDGGFAVQDVSGNKVLQLPGAPLDTFGVLFGPTEPAGLALSVRVHSTKKGRREPAFAIGLNGNAGYKLQVSAAKKLLELYKGEDVVAKEPFAWESDSWTTLKLQVRKVKDGEFAIEGKAWKQGAPEPEKWTVTHVENAEPSAGRASIWGNPFAGTPIDFDDLVVSAVK